MCVLSISATNRRSPSANECVCVCPFFQSALRRASPLLRVSRGLLALTRWTNERDARASEYEIPGIPAGRSQGARGLDDDSRDLRSEQLRFR